MNNKTNILEKYAEVLIKTGVNLYKGQCLLISASPSNYDFAEIVLKKAYQLGAKYVEINCGSNQSLRHRIDFANDETLDYIPDYIKAKFNEFIAEDWAFLSLDNTEEQDILQGSDNKKLSRISKAVRTSKKVFMNQIENDKVAWCVAGIPGPIWAEKVTGSTDENKLWDILIPILQLDSNDPSASWKQKGELTEKRSKILNSFQIKTLNLKSAETDLTIELTKEAVWQGAFSKTQSGRKFLPNIPTEEIFTTPDFSKTSGFVKVTRPLTVLETIVEGAWFQFENGKVIKSGADKNAEILETYLNMDEGASKLGEIALVDKNSPIFKSGKIFHSILYDENASCHIALGAGYPSAFSNSRSLNTDEDKLNQKCNISLVHTDFMIGSDDLSVTATGFDGKKHEIMKNGTFVI